MDPKTELRILRVLVIVLAFLVLAGCGPSCEERGGRNEFSHMQLILVPNGSGGFNQIWTPVYRCELTAGDAGHNLESVNTEED